MTGSAQSVAWARTCSSPSTEPVCGIHPSGVDVQACQGEQSHCRAVPAPWESSEGIARQLVFLAEGGVRQGGSMEGRCS
jgi:hypothetical protein